MNKFKKFFITKKKSILSFMLALVLMLSFNYSPISLLADMVKSNAYKSNTVQTYYPNSSTTSETNIGSGVYPSSLSDYFKDSSNNFNIESYYNKRFSDILAGYVDEFLKNVPDKVGPADAQEGDKVLYKDLYTEFLSSKAVDKDTLLEYYTKNSADIKNKYGCTSFRDYAEYFVSHNIEFQVTDPNNPTKTLYALPGCEYAEGNVEYKMEFYSKLANYIRDESVSIDPAVDVKGEDGESLGQFKDGVADATKFYAQSVSYNRVKDFIDAEIEATVAIYTYDGETQNKNVAAILANKAPASMGYYFKDNTYATKIEEVQKYVMNNTVDKKSVYIMTAETQTLKDIASGAGITTMVYDDTGSLLTNHQKYPLLYRPIEQGEYGYLADYVTYYKYESIPYQTLSDGNYSLFVVDDTVTPDEQATYNFLYVNVIKSTELSSSYVRVPLPESDNDKIYFTTLTGINPTSTEDQARFDKMVDLFTDGSGKSTLYLKYKTTERKIIYIQTGLKAQFQIDNQNYSYLSDIQEFDFASLSEEQKDEYYEIDGSKFSNYYIDGYKLYFKKIKEDYQTLESVQYKTGVYETKNVPNIPFEQHNVVTKEYYMDNGARKIYTFLPDEATNTTSYESITQEVLDAALNNEYVKVPDSIVAKDEMDSTFTYYYRHKTSAEKVNKIYIVVSDENFETEKDNEVYKTLNYTVISKSDYKYKEYISIDKNDANYNENFNLYYKYVSEDELGKNIYIQNQITGKNALFIIDDSVTSSDKTTYKDNGRNFITITTAEYESNYQFYTQLTKDDEFYNLKYTIYYKYNSTNETERLVYSYTTDKNSEYETFSQSSTDYLASDYELILPGDANYVEGTNLYYKKVREPGTETYSPNPTKTTYSYSSTSAVTLNANSYYVVSFYVYTNGTYNDSTTPGELPKPMQASLYVEDSKSLINNASVENISTNGKWQKRYLFIATNSLSASSVKIVMHMGNKVSILGSEDGNYKTATGVVMFDDIKITKINQTDYNKLTIDEQAVQTPPVVEEEPAEPTPDPTPDPAPASEEPTFEYVDKYGNQIIATSSSSRLNDTVNIFNDQTFDKMYDFDSLTDTFANISFANADNIDGYDLPTTELWQMYISRDVSGQGNNYILKQYQKAYKDGKLSVAVVDESSFYDAKLDSLDDDDDDKVIDSDAPDADKTDVAVIKSTFKENNKVLKLQNTSRQLNLGLISNYFTVEQAQYYKLTVWIYSPDEDASATLMLSSILKTASTQDYGSLLSTSANVNANMSEYTTSQVNEYGWIPISFFIEGNALHSQNCYLTLSANKNNTIYFDNISIEKITSSAYDTANSDSDKTTYCLSLSPSTSMLSAGVTNGYFSNVTVTDNYTADNDAGKIDYTLPRTAESWTVSQKSNEVVAGVIPTSDEYLAHSKANPEVGTFYDKYNNYVVPANDLKYNIYGIYIPKTIANPLNNYGGKDTATYNQSGIYRFYSSSISLSASTTYKLTFEFMKGYNFDGKLFANIYTSAVKDANLIETLVVDDSDMDSNWNEYSFYISTDTASATIYLELGVKNASGTCFFRNVSNTSQTKSIDEIRDDMLPDGENVVTPNGQPVVDIYEKECFKFVRFVELNAFEFSVHGNEKDELSNTYELKEFTNDLKPTSTFTPGQSSVSVASYYTTYETVKYTVTIDKVEYYIKEFVDDTTDDKTYKLYSDSNYTNEVTVLNGKAVTLDGKNKVIVGTENKTEYTITETTKTNYIYNFENDLTINNVFISADELKNEISENVIVLANSYSTDYTLITPKYNTKLDASSYYVLKFYVKTSAFEDGFGLNIDLDSSISRKWTNIDTTDSKYDDIRDEKYGFVCYQVLISTGTNAISSFSAKFSLGSKDSTGTGYAIIAGIELEKMASEKLFNEYSLNYDNIDKDSNDTVIKSYFGTVANSSSSTSDSSTNKNDEEDKVESSIWATFFYIFSSLLLGIVLILALVATIIKKHPIKVVKQEENDHDRDSTFVSTSASKSRKTENKTTEETEEVVQKDDGFI